MKRLLYILLDGVGDRPNPQLNYTTPLEAALTPNLDALARQGVKGLVYPVGKGVSPESDIAVFSMLGYDVYTEYPGRGVIEAVGLDLEFKSGDLAVRANFATVDEAGRIIDRRVGRDLSDEEAKMLAQALNEQVKLKGASFRFVHSIGHRAVLVIRAEGESLSGMISNTDPAYERVGRLGVAKEGKISPYIQNAEPLEDSRDAKLAADLINEFNKQALKVLKEHTINQERIKRGQMPGNAVLFRDAGNELPAIKPIYERFGLRFAALTDMPVEKGVAKITGMHSFEAGGVRDYAAKARKALELLSRYSGVYVHLKGPDEPGHDGDPWAKKKVLEEIDQLFFSRLILNIDLDQVVVVISADHATPCTLRAHSSDPVPLLITGGKAGKDGLCRFTERDCAKGSLGNILGRDVLGMASSFLP
ncbi:MAG: alkaline phosphatase family protein [Nitrososphaerales archaeon]